MQTWFTGPQFYFDCVSGGEPLPARRHRVVAVGQFRPSSPTLPDGWASAHILNDEPVAFRQS